jgi:hypothetical protein
MSWKTIAALVVLAAGLGGFFYYDTYWLTPAREKAESAKGRLWTVEPKDVEAVTIKRSGDTIRLKRGDDGGWEMLEPVKTRGDRATIDDVITGLVTVRVDREIDPNPAKPQDFGLEPASAEVRLEIKGRKDPLVLLVGAKSPTGAWTYAREGGKPAVVTVSELVGRDTARPVADFRDKTVIAFDKKSVSGVDLDVGGEHVSLQSEEPGKWRIVAPNSYRADADVVGDFLDKLGAAKVKEFVTDAPASLGSYGLDKPSVVTLWIGKDKERASKTLRFGRAEDKKGVYVARGGEPGVMLAPGDLWTAFPKTVAALRDKVAVAYAYDKVTRVDLASARGHVGFERDGADWKITEPERARADSGAVNSLLWGLRDLRASGFVADASSAIPRYLDKPDVTVKIWEEGVKEPKTVLLKSSSVQSGGRPAAMLAVEGQGPVMLVDAKALADFSKTEADLRDRSVFPAFDMSTVKRARLTTAAGKPLVVEQSGESDWKVLEPSRGPAKATKVTDLLLALRSLRWKEIASPTGEDVSRYGLDHPELEVSLYKTDGAELGTLQVGKQAGDLTYLRVKSGPAIYAVESKGLDDLRKMPSEIPG